jgi:UDP-N-acetylmuramate: L-alanyl-gamma-D-glutamyl-meso-diaminopimelate ligase
LSQNWYNTNLLLMSSGTYSGLDLKQLADEILALPVKEEFPNVKVITEQKEDSSWGGLLSQFKKVFGD